jgi:hypothetical protein
MVDGYDVELNLEVLASFPESSMSRFGNDPGTVSDYSKRWN